VKRPNLAAPSGSGKPSPARRPLPLPRASVNEAPAPAPDPRDPRAAGLLVPPGGALEGRRVLRGLPHDGGAPRKGAAEGPAALRRALSAFTTFDGAGDLAPVADLGDLELEGLSGGDAHRAVEEEARRLFTEGARPVFVGGDHGLTGSVIRGLAAARPEVKLAVVNVDAHLDVREYESAESLASGTPFRRALESGIVTGERLAVIGVRRFANSAYYTRWAREQGVRLYSVEDVAERGPAIVAQEALAAVMPGADALYLSVDMDVVDAGAAPGVSAPGIGGLPAGEALALVRALVTAPVAGADIMELAPPLDEGGRTARLAARLLLEILNG
jgi:formiminoglutamase